MVDQPDGAELAQFVPFMRTLGITVTHATPETVVGRLAYDESLTTVGGALNGGALMSLADNVAALCAFLNLPPDGTTTTTNSTTTFLRAARSDVTATSRPLHVGRTTIVVVSELRDEQDRLVAQVTQSQAVLAAR